MRSGNSQPYELRAEAGRGDPKLGQGKLPTRYAEMSELDPAVRRSPPQQAADEEIPSSALLLRVDVQPAIMPDRDGQFLVFDTYVRYLITDALRFEESLRNEAAAAATISDIVISQLRAVVGLLTQPEIIGGRPDGI